MTEATASSTLMTSASRSEAEASVDAFDRAVRTQAAWYRVGEPIERPSAAVEQAAKALTKDLARRITDTVQDRHTRAQVRVELYNVLLPVFLDFSQRQCRQRKRLHAVSWVLAGVAVVATAAAWLT